jgi:hypothetical protein
MDRQERRSSDVFGLVSVSPSRPQSHVESSVRSVHCGQELESFQGFRIPETEEVEGRSQTDEHSRQL